MTWNGIVEATWIVNGVFGFNVTLAVGFASCFHQVAKAIAVWQWGGHFLALVFSNGFKEGTCSGCDWPHSAYSVSVFYKNSGLD